jgi:hypothetical protein
MIMKLICAALLLAAFLSGTAAGAAAPLYRLAETIPLGGDVKWDYLYLDPVTGHLLISHDSEVTAVDVDAGRIAGRLTGLQGSHGIAIDPLTGLGYADSGKTATVSIFDPRSLRILRTIPALEDADGMAFDAASNQVFIAGGDAQAVLAIDAAGNRHPRLIPLAGSPEFLVVDGDGDLFVNIHDKNQVVKIDTARDVITARWDVPGCAGPTGLAVDPHNERLFSTCRNGRMAVLDTGSGKLIALLPIGAGTDAARFDPRTHLIFSSNRDGSLTVIHELDGRHFQVLPAVETALGARTMEIDPKNGDVFLVTADVLGLSPSDVPGQPPRYEFRPGSCKLLVYQPQP